MTFLVPAHFFTYMFTTHFILFILSVIFIARSGFSTYSKIMLTLLAFFIPVIGGIITLAILAFSVEGKKFFHRFYQG